MSIEAARKIISDRGPALRAADLREIQLLLIDAPLEAQHQAEPWIWESIARIISDPEYRGDITQADLAGVSLPDAP